MNFLMMIKHIFSNYFQNNIYIVIVLAGVTCLLLFRKPKLFLIVFFISLILTGVLYLISTLSTKGVYEEQKYIYEEKQLYRNFSGLKIDITL